MKNNFELFMREHNIEVDERAWIDVNEDYALSVIPEYNHHYRDENDRMHISPRNEPYSIELNVMLFKRDPQDDEYDIAPNYEQQSFETAADLTKHIKKLRHELLLNPKSQ
jgi:hypothetical protein